MKNCFVFIFTTIHSTGENVYILERIDSEANEGEHNLYWLYCFFDSTTSMKTINVLESLENCRAHFKYIKYTKYIFANRLVEFDTK